MSLLVNVTTFDQINPFINKDLLKASWIIDTKNQGKSYDSSVRYVFKLWYIIDDGIINSMITSFISVFIMPLSGFKLSDILLGPSDGTNISE